MFHRNSSAANPGVYPYSDILSIRAAQRAHEQISRCPYYRATPLRKLPGAAHRVRVASVLYKDEAERFGIGSFKALGGAYAVAQLLAHRISQRLGREVAIEELARGEHVALTRDMTVVCATDGNHGRAVAAGARVFRCKCVIFLHAGVSAQREAAIAEFGAKIVRTPGNYDDSVRAAACAASDEGWQIVSDTSWSGYETVPAMVMQGYTYGA